MEDVEKEIIESIITTFANIFIVLLIAVLIFVCGVKKSKNDAKQLICKQLYKGDLAECKACIYDDEFLTVISKIKTLDTIGGE